MKKLSLVVATCLLTTNMMAETIDDAFKNGKVEGSLGVYGISQKFKTEDIENRNNAYGNGNLTLGYVTGGFYGFSLGAQVKGNVKLGEKHKHDWKEKAPFENSALITQAYLQYSIDDMLEIKAGRYEGDLEWLTDYQQGAVAQISAIPDTVISLAYSNRKSESGIDMSEKFHKPDTMKKGIYVFDLKNESIENLEINPYYYQIPKAAKFYGLKTTYALENFGAIAHYAKSSLTSEYKSDEELENGYIAHFELNANVEDFTSALGLIKTSKKGGAEAIASYGDNISPFEDGNQIYTLDARTIYASLGYSIADFEFGALYGITRYDLDEDNSGLKEKELNLSAGYNFTKTLNTNLMYVNVKADKDQEDSNYNKYLASVEYKF